MEKFHLIGCHVLWRELCHFASFSRNVLQFNFLKQGLHQTPDTLRDELQRAIDQADDGYSAVLLGYGLCCNSLEGIEARNIPLVIPRAHDCITLLLGSKGRYQQYFDRNPGTYWYSPGWIETGTQPEEEAYTRTLAEYTEKYGKDNAEYLMKIEQGWQNRYSKAAYVDLGFGNTEEYKSFTKQCAKELGWDCDILAGDPRLIVNLLAGVWDEEDFLVVQPGETVAASHDEMILKPRA